MSTKFQWLLLFLFLNVKLGVPSLQLLQPQVQLCMF